LANFLALYFTIHCHLRASIHLRYSKQTFVNASQGVIVSGATVISNHDLGPVNPGYWRNTTIHWMSIHSIYKPLKKLDPGMQCIAT
jgi:hypothetical protein